MSIMFLSVHTIHTPHAKPTITYSAQNNPAITYIAHYQPTITYTAHNEPTITYSAQNDPTITSPQSHTPPITSPQSHTPPITSPQSHTHNNATNRSPEALINQCLLSPHVPAMAHSIQHCQITSPGHCASWTHDDVIIGFQQCQK